MRNHNPVLIEEFNGLWKRGDNESCPVDHFTQCNNVKYVQSGFQWRDGVSPYQIPLGVNVVRMYSYIREGGESLIVLNDRGQLYDTGSPTPDTPILTITGMADFGFTVINGRGYISPNDGNVGLQNEFVYVYQGRGLPVRKAAGAGPVGTMSAAISATSGNVETGYHVFGVIYETDTGFLTKIGGKVALNVTTSDKKVDISNIPVSPDSYVKKRHIVVTKAVIASDFTNDLDGYEYYRIPGATLDDNTSTTISVNFYETELLDNVSHLLDAYEAIPASAGLNTYHNRLLAWAQYGLHDPDPDKDTLGNISRVLVSAPGEPESIDQVDGLIVVPLDSLPVTNCQEYRDTLYVFKRSKTYSYVDSGDVPSSWPLVIIDQGTGASLHGVATVLDSGGVNIDFLLITDFSGVLVFNGSFARPELSWKIKDYWINQDKSKYNKIQIINDTLNQMIYIVLVNGQMLTGSYEMGMDYIKIKWTPWTFNFFVTTIAIVNLDTLIIGSNGPADSIVQWLS